MKFFLLVLKNLRRNRVRSLLTALAVVFLVAIFSMIVSVLLFLNNAMELKNRDIKMVVTERYRIPSRFDRSYMDRIVLPGSSPNSQLALIPGFHAEQQTVWNFIGFTLDPNDPPKDKDLFFFAIATLPEKIPTMIDGLEGFDAGLCKRMKEPPRSHTPNIGILMGPDRLKTIKKKVGDIFPARSISHRDGVDRKPIEMEFEVVGELPGDSRWAGGAFMDIAYLDRVLKDKKSELDGKVNLGWLLVDDAVSANQVGGTIEQDIREIKCETAATAVARFLEAYKSLLWGMQFLLVPAIIAVMMVIVANAISITVRERTTEMAVLKILGFSKGRVLTLVLGEGILLGIVGGLLGAGITYWLVNGLVGGLKIPIGFFGVFFITSNVWWWGPGLGAATAILGGILPAWKACSVKVSEVFSKVA